MIYRNQRGLTLVEIVFVFVILTVVAGLGLRAMNSGDKKGSVAALSVALADEFRSARQLAISSGHPVAIGMPGIGNNKVADSVYQLEGWNLPTVKRSRSFRGDYPGFAFAPATWSSATNTGTGTGAPLISKFTDFNLDNWIPEDYDNDAIYCFTPDGGVMSNDQPTVDGRFSIVVAQNLVASGGEATGGGEPRVVFIDQAGGVEVSDLLTGLSSGAEPDLSEAVGSGEEPEPGVYISEIVVTPDPGSSTTFDGICVPGQHITLEIYAYERGGRQLFAKWTQTASTGATNGTFSYPDSQADVTALEGELERMEYLDEAPDGVSWGSAPEPSGGVWRGRWTWTVPVQSTVGDSWELEADVRDVTGTVTILNGPPPTFSLKPAPKGRLLIQRINPNTGLSELVRMNPDGSGEHVLSSPGVEEILPSVDRSGSRVAYLSRPQTETNFSVRVRNLEGGQETIIAGPGNYTSVSLSPNGRWVSYRDASSSQLITREVKQSGPISFSVSQTWGNGDKGRTGWDPGERYMLFARNSILYSIDLTASDPASTEQPLFGPLSNSGVVENLFAPTVFPVVDGSGTVTGHRVAFTIGSTDPVQAHIPYQPTTNQGGTTMGAVTKPDLDGTAGTGSGSSAQNDNYPSISSDGKFLILSREPEAGGTPSALLVEWNGSNFVGPPKQTLDNVLFSIWIPED